MPLSVASTVIVTFRAEGERVNGWDHTRSMTLLLAGSALGHPTSAAPFWKVRRADLDYTNAALKAAKD